MSSNSPASQAEATAALRALFTAFPADRGEANGVSGAYRMAIDGYSLQAIEGAVKRIIRGEVSDIDKRFLPTPAQLGNLVAYMDKLYAPPEPRMALPAPGDVEPTEEEWARRKAQADAARERFGIKPTTGETVVDREAMPEALKAERDREVQRAAAKLKGRMELSPEARAIFREGLSDRVVPSPDEQFDAWDNPQQSERGVAA
jgi:uncharacterized membrane protein